MMAQAGVRKASWMSSRWTRCGALRRTPAGCGSLRAARSPCDRWSSPPALPGGGLASPRQPSGGKLWHLPPPGRRPAVAGTSEDHPGRRCDRSRLAGRHLGPQIPCCRVTGGCRQPVLAPRAGGL